MSAPSLQLLSEVTIVNWLLQWAGSVGRVAVGGAISGTAARPAKVPATEAKSKSLGAAEAGHTSSPPEIQTIVSTSSSVAMLSGSVSSSVVVAAEKSISTPIVPDTVYMQQSGRTPSILHTKFISANSKNSETDEYQSGNSSDGVFKYPSLAVPVGDLRRSISHEPNRRAKSKEPVSNISYRDLQANVSHNSSTGTIISSEEVPITNRCSVCPTCILMYSLRPEADFETTQSFENNRDIAIHRKYLCSYRSKPCDPNEKETFSLVQTPVCDRYSNKNLESYKIKECEINYLNETIMQENVKNSTKIWHSELAQSNIDYCYTFLITFIPSILCRQVISTAWTRLVHEIKNSSKVAIDTDYKVKEWMQRAPIIMILSEKFSSRMFSLNTSSISYSKLAEAIECVCKRWPLHLVNELVFSGKKPVSKKLELSSLGKSYVKTILESSSLISVTLGPDFCCDEILSTLSKLSLKELNISGPSITEEGVIRNLFWLNFKNGSDILDLVQCGFGKFSGSTIQRTLKNFKISCSKISSKLYSAILMILPHLEHYVPYRNIVQCILTYIQHCCHVSLTTNTLKLSSLDLLHANPLEIARICQLCPKVRHVSLTIEPGSEQSVFALQSFSHLSNLELMYYPSFTSSATKINAQIIKGTIQRFQNQLECLTLNGFNISSDVFHVISQLPDLKVLKLEECWVSPNIGQSSTGGPNQTPILVGACFGSLEILYLKFLPPPLVLHQLVFGGVLQTLTIDAEDFQYEANSLSDSHIKTLIDLGLLRSLKSIRITSKQLTMKSLELLASLPELTSVGYLHRWGLTKDELACVSHSKPQHLLYIL
ncbi:unnamed protein product [Meganyctiphanes norvegica]|uniref:Uncharacterized protein n=1 Tax=Meganyctiphanes norvegica TaxID=48144 RepID=A0AAV2RC95_MEGNR